MERPEVRVGVVLTDESGCYTKDKFTDAKYMKEQLAAMAREQNIQSEIAAINEEFALAEMDGLEGL